MAQGSDRLDLAAMALMVALCALWGLNQVSIKVGNAGISPLLQSGLRSAGAALLLWAWSRRRGIALFERDGAFWLGVVTAVLFTGEFALLYGSLEFTTASQCVVFLYTAPFVVALGGNVAIAGERLRAVHWLGLVAAFIGVTIAFADVLGLPDHRQLLGDVMAFAAAMCWGLTTVLVKATRLIRLAPQKVLFYQLAGSAVLLPALALLAGERGIIALTPPVVASFVFQTAVIAFWSYLAWFQLIARLPAFKLAAFSFLTPLFGVIAGGVLLGETITPALLAALALVAVGIALVNREPAAPATRAPAASAVGD